MFALTLALGGSFASRAESKASSSAVPSAASVPDAAAAPQQQQIPAPVPAIVPVPAPVPDAPLVGLAKRSSGAPAGAASTQPIPVPRLDKGPAIEDFLSGKPASEAAKAMREVTGFIDRDPKDGSPASEETYAYFGYTRANLYVAFVCHEKNPGDLRAHLLPRDNLGDDDKVEVTFDTFLDHRRGLMFQSNALGIQADATYTEGIGPDFSFDTVWDTWGRRTPFGYVVLMRIPFQSLRFRQAPAGEPQVWGIVLRRWIAHATERAYWPRITRQIAGRLTQDAPIEGFVDVQRGHNVQFIPYALGQSYRKLDNRNPLAPTFDDKHFQGTGGLDGKFVIRDSLVLDATLNPDFSQVNVDDPASPNQRFQPFFLEQRPFFIENSGYFQTPIDLFYTLNIASPQYGLRLSGKKGPWAVGLLAADDRKPGQAAAPGTPLANSRAYFYVARVARDIGKFSTVGLLYTDREYQNSFNRLGGFDYRWRFLHQWTLTGQAVASATRNLDNSTQSGNSYKQNLNFTNVHFLFNTTYNDTAKGFLDEAGFFRRPDDREWHIHSRYLWRPNGKVVLTHGPEVYLEQDWDHTGLPIESIAHFNYNVQFSRNTQFIPFVELETDRLRPSDYAGIVQNVEYRSPDAGLALFTSPIPQVSFNIAGYAGQNVNYSPPANQPPGPTNVQSINTSLELKPFTQLDLQNRYEFDRFRAPGASFIAYDDHLFVSRWNLQLTRALAVRLIGIYQATLPNARYTAQQSTRDLFGDALISYVPHPGTAIYLGYTTDAQNLDRNLCTRLPNSTCNPNGIFLGHGGNTLLSDSRTFYMKVSYLLRF